MIILHLMAENCALIDLECITEFPLAGLKQRLWVIRREDVLFVPRKLDGTVLTAPVKIRPGSAFRYYDLQKDSIRWSEVQKGDRQGDYYEQVLEGYRPKNEPEHNHELYKLKSGYYILFYQDNTGQTRLLGDIVHPFFFRSASGIDKDPGAKNGATWRFEAKSPRPAPFVDPAIEIPNELLIPFAKLGVLEDSSGDCLFQIRANGSLLADGSAISAATPPGSALLQYTFSYGGNELYTAVIAPNADAGVMGNWTYLSGNRDASEFESQIVDNASGTGFQFTLDLTTLSLLDAPGTLTISLLVDDHSEESNTASTSIPLCNVAPAITMDTTKQAAFTIIMTVTEAQNITVDWGDGTTELFAGIPAEVGQTFVHNYAAPGTYPVQIFCAAHTVKTLNMDNQGLVNIMGINRCNQIKYFYADNNDLDSVIIGAVNTFIEFYIHDNPNFSDILNITTWNSIKLLYIHTTSIQDLILGTRPSLTHLHASSITTFTGAVDISGCENLQVCYLNNSQFTEFISGNHPALTTFEARNSYGHTSVLNCSTWASAISIQFYGSTFTGLQLGVHNSLTILYGYSADLTGTVDISNCPALQHCNLYSNYTLDAITTGVHNSLTQFRVQNNNLSSADISGMPALQSCYLNSNPITALTTGTHASLTSFEMRDTPYTGTITITTWTSIDNLQLQGSSFSDLIWGALAFTELGMMNLTDNNIPAATLNSLVDAIYTDRATNPDTTKFLYMAGNNGPLSSTALDQIYGTGAYAGDGLVDNDWTVTVPS